MDAVSNKNCAVYFGGRYYENWSEDYTLSIKYENRRQVLARYPPRRQEYFQTAATVYTAISACLARGLQLSRLNECFQSEGKPLAAPELMRLLMDDCGLPLEEAYRVTGACCDDLSCTGIQPQYIKAYQPRTAHVVSLLRQTAGRMPALVHDSRKTQYRSKFGAVKAGSELRLAFQCRGGRIKHAELVLWGDDFESSRNMEQEHNEFYVNLTLPEQPQALWYAFYVETESSAHWLCPDKTGFLGRLYPRREEGFRLTVYRKDFETPVWFRRSVMYQIFPDRFGFSRDGTAEKGIAYHEKLGQYPEHHRSLDEPVRYQPRSFERAYTPDDFYGGTFRGIEEKLPYLKALGVSCLYLNPIVEARSNHRYDTSDYRRPDPILGSVEDFRRLCDKARRCGIRILLAACFPTPATTACTLTNSAAMEATGPAAVRTLPITAGTISSTFRMNTAAGGASRPCRRCRSKTPPGSGRSSPGPTAWCGSGSSAAPPAGGWMWRTSCRTMCWPRSAAR